MTEQTIRRKVEATVRSWLGAKKGDPTHHQIIDIYNSHKPLPRGVRMSYAMEWCAATVSAVAIVNGLTDIMPVECSCGEMMRAYQAMGRWVEDDDYVPQSGDVLFYAWGDNGKGDCAKAPNHVGIVETVNPELGTMTVIEGNMGRQSVVGCRTLDIGGRYIRGYGLPDYAVKADKPPVSTSDTSAPWYAPAQAWAKDRKIADGTRPTDPCTRAEVWEMLKNYDRVSQEAREGA